MNWRQFDRSDLNIVTLGRLAAVGMLVAGIILAMLDASAQGHLVGSHGELRYFLAEATGYAWKAGLLFAAAELAGRFGWGREEKFDWHGVRVLYALGLAVLVTSSVLSVWNVRGLHASNSAIVRLEIHSLIGAFWSGGVLLLAAALLDNVDWNDREADVPDEALA